MFCIAVAPENSFDTTAAAAVVTTPMNRDALHASAAKRTLRPIRNEAGGQSQENDALNSSIYPPHLVYMLS